MKGKERQESGSERSDNNFLVICCDYDCHRRSQKLVTHPLSEGKTGCPSLEFLAGVPDVYSDRQGALVSANPLCVNFAHRQ